MPLDLNRQVSEAGKVYGRVFVGKAEYSSQIAVDITALTDDEIDDQGFIKPGVPLTKAGALAGAGDVVHGVTFEPLDVLHLLPFSGVTKAAAIAAAGTQEIAVGTIGQVNRAIIEDNLGRALTVDEVAAFADSTLQLLG